MTTPITDRKAFCDDLEIQLTALESEVTSVTGKLAHATSVEKSAMTQLIDRFPEDALKVRREIAAMRQDREEYELEKSGAAVSLTELRALVDSAKAAYGE